MTDRTASRSDARKRRAGEIVRDLIADLPPIPDSTLKPGDRVAVHCDGTTRTLTVPLPHQENPMTAKTRHDELKALLNKISEESVSTSNVLADVLDLLRERLPEPEVYHCIACGENYPTKLGHDCPTPDGRPEPAEVTEDQPVGTRVVVCNGLVAERIERGWREWTEHGWSGYAWSFDYLRLYFAPLRLATPADIARVGIEADPRPDSCCGKCPPIVGGGYDCTCEGNPKCHCGSVRFGYPDHICTKATGHEGPHGYAGVFWSDPAPADDLPGEPVEPGDLRAGDRVEFTYKGERITCNLVSGRLVVTTLRSNVPDSGGYTPNVVFRGRWDSGISDVRLIERGPREGEDPDEALARVIARHLDISWNGTNEAGRSDLCTAARAAREHIEAEQEEVVATLREEVAIQTARAEQAEVWMSKWQQSCNDARDERDALRERLDALRDDIVNGRLLSAAEAAFGGWLIARDDERAAKGGSDA